ncbi:MAG: hypothetical protein R3E58_20745 [Phycisphaerae bacterium]
MQSDFVNLKVESPEPVKYKVERWSVAASIGSTVFLLWPLSYIIIGFTAIVVRGVLYLVHVLGFDVDAVPDLVVIVFAFSIGVLTTYLAAKRIYLVCRWTNAIPDGPICHQCRYNLTGNESGICPECGTPIATHDS